MFDIKWIKAFWLTIFCIITSTYASAQDLSRYVGIYQSEVDSNIYLRVELRDDKLYMYNSQGVMEVALSHNNTFDLVNFYAGGAFSNVRKGKFQQIIYRDWAYQVRYSRVDSVGDKNVATISHQPFYAADLGHTNPEQCQKRLPI